MSEQEKFDVLDERGNKTGKVLPRDTVHEQELWHGSVHIWIINSEGKILLQFRAANKRIFPSCWDTSVAGHISADDTPIDAALREIGEEIGITVDEDQLNYVGFMSEELQFITGGTHREHNWIYILHKDLDIHEIKIQESELTKVKWFTASELKEILHTPARRSELSGHADKLYELALKAAQEKHGK